MANVDVTVAELESWVGRDLGYSSWLVIDQPRIDRFAEATEDRQWIHVDPDRAASGPFGATIAHGYLTLSLVPYFFDQLLCVTDQARGTNYGVEQVRFTSPVTVGSSLRMRGDIRAVRTRGDGGAQFTFGFQIELRGQERPALVGEVTYLAYTG